MPNSTQIIHFQKFWGRFRATLKPRDPKMGAKSPNELPKSFQEPPTAAQKSPTGFGKGSRGPKIEPEVFFSMLFLNWRVDDPPANFQKRGGVLQTELTRPGPMAWRVFLSRSQNELS